jgi:hypothetical protein
MKWSFLRFDVNVRPAVSLISKAHKYETNNTSMMSFALACCEKNGLSVCVSINIKLPPAVPASLNIDALPHSYHGCPSTSSVLMVLEQIEVLNEVLDDETISEYSSHDDMRLTMIMYSW